METNVIVIDKDVETDEIVTLISPKDLVPPEIIFLSNIDQAVTFPVETLYFFQVEEDKKAPTNDIAEKVKKATCELLIPYYFMAGRLKFNGDLHKLELVCNNVGIPFVSASSKLMLSDLGDLSLPNPTFGYFIHRPNVYGKLDERPLLTIKVTRFKCGGFSVGFLTSHAILDGKAACEMFLNLVSICKGEGLKFPVICNNRTSIKARNPPTIKYPHNEYIMLPKISSLATAFTTSYESAPSPLIFANKYSHKLFKFNLQMITLLKDKSKIKCSTFEAIIAHIWKQRTKAVFDKSDDLSTVLFAVDIRSIISPPLPNGFVGNAVVTAFATSKVNDLLENPISFGVRLIKEAKERITEDYIRSVIDWLEIYKGIPATTNGNFYVSAWCKLPFGDLDFGYGRPIHMGPVLSGSDEFVLLLSEGNANQNRNVGINIWMGLEKEKMKKFITYVFDI
ncbi:acyltransferase GLAUCE-like [Silene latifolia]|uniref:acyltransferase GLAUCE-like n=1 Tax=Silene latifolia TaxID=37657 RepID=UPI003D785A09